MVTNLEVDTSAVVSFVKGIWIEGGSKFRDTEMKECTCKAIYQPWRGAGDGIPHFTLPML